MTTLSRLLARWGLLIVFMVVFGAFSAWLPDKFPTSGNVQDILTSQPPGIFIAYAAMLGLVVGEFDLSSGATLGLSQYLVLKLITHYGLSWPAAIAATLGVGMAIGGANALAVVGLGVAALGVSGYVAIRTIPSFGPFVGDTLRSIVGVDNTIALEEAALAAIKSKNTYLAAQYQRLKPRIGHGRALGAVKHSMLIAYWHMFTTGETYNDLGGDHFQRRDPQRATKRLVAKLEALGHHVTLEGAAA